MKLNIFKYNPSKDANPHYIDVEVEYLEHMSVLEAIEAASVAESHSCSFDYSCVGRVCGRCAIMLDGKPVLACCTPITDEPHTIEPLRGQPVIRDLIVDKTEAHDDISARYRRVRGDQLTGQELYDGFDMDYHHEIEAIEWCARCMVCTSHCPVYNDPSTPFIGPAAMLAEAFRKFDMHDEGNRSANAVQAGLWDCIMCGACDDVCPQPEIIRVGRKNYSPDDPEYHNPDLPEEGIWDKLRAAVEADGYQKRESKHVVEGKK